MSTTAVSVIDESTTMEAKIASVSLDAVAASPPSSTAVSSAAEEIKCPNYTEQDATDQDSTLKSPSSIICQYYQRGMCRFGALCHFSHDVTLLSNNNERFDDDNVVDNQQEEAGAEVTGLAMQNPGPSTSRNNWVNAPVYIPKAFKLPLNEVDYNGADDDGAAVKVNPTWAEIVGNKTDAHMNMLKAVQPKTILELCPYESPCPFVGYCGFALHMELCEMCDRFCLHPNDEEQRKDHKKECLKQHEQAMELSFAIARSKDKTCGICFDTIMEKAGREKRFGILPNCNHIFCLECIRKWRKAKQFEHKIIRSCPECRVASDFVCPSAFWVETKEDKDKLLDDYRKALGVKDCKYFKKGNGKCPFGNKCFYKHALPNGVLVDVGCPKKARKMLRSNTEIINLLDMYLYEFLEQRDLTFLDFLATSTSDDSDHSDH